VQVMQTRGAHMIGEGSGAPTPVDLPPVEGTPSTPFSAPTPDEAGARMPRWVPRLILMLVLTTIGVLAFVYALGKLHSFIGTLVVALFASFALEPAVNWLARHGWKRGLATMTVMLVTAVLVAVVVAAMVPLLVKELQALILAIPSWVAKIDPLLQRWFGTSISEVAASSESQQLLRALAGWGANVAGNLLGLVSSFVGAVFQVFTVALFAFYLIADGPKVRRAVLSMVRPRTQREVLRSWDVAIEKTGGYLYSRMLLAAVSALFTFAMMTILRLPFAIPLAIWVGLVSQFIPTVGTYIAAALPVLLALLHSPTKAIALLVFFVAYQQIENYLFAPRVTAHTMNMHAAVAFGSVIVGAALFGALGAFLAIPGAAILQALVWTSLSRYEVVADGLTEEAPADAGGASVSSLWQRLTSGIARKRKPK
jgi:predicted PurR-regulated permease PerM